MTDDTLLLEVGETVALTTVDSDPWLLVCAVDEAAGWHRIDNLFRLWEEVLANG
jgi:hypothetical protein